MDNNTKIVSLIDAENINVMECARSWSAGKKT